MGQVDALIVDDWAMAPLADAERRAFLEICDERYQTRIELQGESMRKKKPVEADKTSAAQTDATGNPKSQ